MPNPYHDPRNGRFTTGPGSAAAKLRAADAMRQYRSQGKSRPGGLNVTASAPPKSKPVILVYGGAFNPPHEGHTKGALEAAHVAIASGGYKVDRSIVVPTADKLLAAKQMDEQFRLDLEARGRLAEVAFPTEIKGSPVDVEIEPSQIVERAEGKPRRTDLARWAQEKYPNHTIINVTGEDAVVPGAPAQHPSVYAGADGSSHEGFYYLTLPRDEGSISSTAIRSAAATGERIPGMSMASQRAYRAELAKRSESASKPKSNAQRQADLAAKHGMTVSEYKAYLAKGSRKMTDKLKSQNNLTTNPYKPKVFGGGINQRRG